VRRRLAWAGSLFFLALVLGAAYAVPAAADHKPGHTSQGVGGEKSNGEENGKAGDSGNGGFTEDNDTNDGDTPNNVSDGGDNEHPSGNDRSIENGNSGNQGKSSSDPDNDGRGPDRENGGPDKPNGSGGNDKADQDGNNGCGNDDDFEDDNEGWCGKKPGNPPEKPPEEPPEEPPVNPPDGPDGTDGPDVLGDVLERPDHRAATGAGGVAAGVSASGAPLPFTGSSFGMILIAAIAAIVIGLFTMRVRRNE
jgi:hypothetical protein